MATPPAVEEQVTALMDQQDAVRSKAIAAAIALAVARTRSFDEWYSTAAITAWALALARDIEVIQRNLARSTDVFLARTSSVMTGRTVRPVGAVPVANLRQGITHAGAYGRVADVFRYQQSRVEAGDDVEAALEAAVQRASDVAEMDTQLVVRAQSQAFMVAQPAATEQPQPIAEAQPTGEPEQQPNPTAIKPKGKPRLIGYRRMVHPEMSKGGSCGMCIVASTRLYFREDLMPMHVGCHCLPMAVYEGADPGGLINDSELKTFYDNAGSNLYLPLRHTRYQIDEHGELGPVLNRYGTPFRTPDDVRKAEAQSRNIPRRRR